VGLGHFSLINASSPWMRQILACILPILPPHLHEILAAGNLR
jgi:hypothetical protein